MELTNKEIELLISGLKKLDHWDLEIDAEYDNSDYMAVQMNWMLPSEEMERQKSIIADELYRVKEEKSRIIEPIIAKLNDLKTTETTL